MAKVYAPLIRALAHTGLHSWAYCDTDGGIAFDHLLAHGTDAYVLSRAAELDAMGIRPDVKPDTQHALDAGRNIVDAHATAFAHVVTDAFRSNWTDASVEKLCKLIVDCDDVVLAWWCEHKFGPAMEDLATDHV